MVPILNVKPGLGKNSPRIRGDRPHTASPLALISAFSPYSRGWSPNLTRIHNLLQILPVFAGMVPVLDLQRKYDENSPRIRGDGPMHKGDI